MSAPVGRVPPHDLGAERAVLGHVLLDNAVLDELEHLSPADMYADRNAAAFMAMRRLWNRRETIDLVTLRAELVAIGDLARAGGDEALLGLTESVPSGSVLDHAKIVRGHADVRAVVLAAHRIAARGYEAIGDAERFVDEAEAAITGVASARRHDDAIEDLDSVLDGAVRNMHERQERGGRVEIPTGFRGLDRMLGGLEPGQLVIAAGRPGMGKSAFAQAVALAVTTTAQRPAAIFSLEMEAQPWGRRFLLSVGSVDGMRARRGELTQADWARINGARAKLRALPMRIIARAGLTLYQVRSYARRIRAQFGDLALVVVDYLQLMRWHERLESREAEFSEISRGLKELAKELACPVLALCQLNREVEKNSDKRPQLAHLRNSGAIEQDADAVLGLFRPWVYHPTKADPRHAEIVVLKQREGSIGTVRASFVQEYTRFEDYDPSEFDDGQRTMGGIR